MKSFDEQEKDAFDKKAQQVLQEQPEESPKEEVDETKSLLQEFEAIYNEGLGRFLKLKDDSVSNNSLWRVLKKLAAHPDREHEVVLKKKSEKSLYEMVNFLHETKEMINLQKIKLHHEELAKGMKEAYKKAEDFEQNNNNIGESNE